MTGLRLPEAIEISAKRHLDSTPALGRGHRPRTGAKTISIIKEDRKPQRGEGLSKQEKRVLQLQSEGLTDKEIAREMSISLGTVRVYVKRARQKLGSVDSVTDVIKALLQEEIYVPGLKAVRV